MDTTLSTAISTGMDTVADRTREGTLNLVAAYLGDYLLSQAEKRERFDALMQVSDGTDVDLCLAQLTAAEDITRTMKAKQTSAVLDARALGATWEDIGAALGLTRQAAQQRYRSIA